MGLRTAWPPSLLLTAPRLPSSAPSVPLGRGAGTPASPRGRARTLPLCLVGGGGGRASSEGAGGAGGQAGCGGEHPSTAGTSWSGGASWLGLALLNSDSTLKKKQR